MESPEKAQADVISLCAAEQTNLRGGGVEKGVETAAHHTRRAVAAAPRDGTQVYHVTAVAPADASYRFVLCRRYSSKIFLLRCKLFL